MAAKAAAADAATAPHLRVLDVLAADGAAELLHEGLELAEAVQNGLVGQEANVLDVVVGLVLEKRDETRRDTKAAPRIQPQAPKTRF